MARYLLLSGNARHHLKMNKNVIQDIFHSPYWLSILYNCRVYYVEKTEAICMQNRAFENSKCQWVGMMMVYKLSSLKHGILGNLTHFLIFKLNLPLPYVPSTSHSWMQINKKKKANTFNWHFVCSRQCLLHWCLTTRTPYKSCFVTNISNAVNML